MPVFEGIAGEIGIREDDLRVEAGVPGFADRQSDADMVTRIGGSRASGGTGGIVAENLVGGGGGGAAGSGVAKADGVVGIDGVVPVGGVTDKVGVEAVV